MVWMWLISTALAGSAAGMGLSPLGGGLAGITDPGVLGIGHTPAAARPDRPELALDVGLTSWRIQAQLDGQAPAEGSGVTPLPYFAAAVPIGPVGIGLTGRVPYGGGGDFPQNGAQRFHMVEAKVFMMETDLAVAVQPVDFLRIGVAGRFARGTLQKRYAINPAGLINGLLDDSMTALDGTEFSEGSQKVDLVGYGWGYAAGISATLPADIEVHLAYWSPVRIELKGPATVVPSSDLDLSLKGTAHTTMVYPRELALGVAVPVGMVRLMADGGWTGWSTMERVDGTLEDITVRSENAGLEALVLATGINESDFTESMDVYNDLGNHDVFYGGLASDFAVHKQWVIRTGVWYAPSSIPDETFQLGVVDFPAWDLRAAVSWTPIERLTLGTSIDLFAISGRTIRDSDLALTNPSQSGRVYPSANGDYKMRAVRFGLTIVARL